GGCRPGCVQSASGEAGVPSELRIHGRCSVKNSFCRMGQVTLLRYDSSFGFGRRGLAVAGVVRRRWFRAIPASFYHLRGF
ncbi:MAG: hypothetical protein KDA59_11385, partial [Planctomycetales bacterium]|nr:hypothetical protein [Planctomycetales bacterium]